jgi:hypothetical protein
MRSGIILVAVSVGAAGCGSRPPVNEPQRASHPPPPVDPSRPPPASVAANGNHGACAVRDADTKVRAQMIDRGAALVFTTSDDVAHLRDRAAYVSVPASLTNVAPRLDKIQYGVRLVFEVESSDDVPMVRRGIREHARQIAKTCGLVLAAPTDWTAEQRMRAESSRPAERPKAQSKATQATKASTEKQKEAQADKSKGKPAAKTDAKPNAKPAEKPKPPNSPTNARKPREHLFPQKALPAEGQATPRSSVAGTTPDSIDARRAKSDRLKA